MTRPRGDHSKTGDSEERKRTSEISHVEMIDDTQMSFNAKEIWNRDFDPKEETELGSQPEQFLETGGSHMWWAPWAQLRAKRESDVLKENKGHDTAGKSRCRG